MNADPKMCRTILAKALILLRTRGSRSVPCFLGLPAKANSDGVPAVRAFLGP